ncbi:hypothetical protein RchiOBHm_Chr2g0107571 [Rosa chinensis]|uniref:Uncharacterized protein n=1 Tax=Rosa chinensis TaxID=74649 RepID=A0A2P6RNZ8_ROSCH|nr:hypothetical protein RchiOBHm_Chr2g0107571 [Rosa chinensis]
MEAYQSNLLGIDLCFNFDSEIDCNHYLHGGSWFYRNIMLLLAPYDRIWDVETIPIHSLELCITLLYGSEA